MKISLYPSLIAAGLAILTCGAAGCDSGSSESSAPEPGNSAPAFPPLVIKTGVENGHPAGIRIAIQTTTDTDTTTQYQLISSYEGKPVGLILVIPRKDKDKKTGSSAYFKSLGSASDLFLRVLASEYQQQLDPSAKFADSIPFVCMNLKDFFRDNPADTAKGDNWVAAEYKLFFDSESIDGDAEMFMNINPKLQWIELAEKDEDYRAHLVSLFKKH